ncbi:PEP-CTERM sorting domain-containing protein [Roseiterribacter gracilis]|uniref:Ice-binding protein C-terminal domain-containing protein n=1 Tax=Roseiterribacter gracilis TaxID=2812848 RepID=A0A8S8X936_9PROT|nr:hypothetical protein TMPK1_06480 [Rhodospirillales bacterium TMPK1]
MFKILASTALVALALGVAPHAKAAPVSLGDAYVGGNDHGYGDVIGTSVFDTTGATVTRSGTHLIVTIATNFAGAPGSAAAEGTTYGDLLLSANWSPTGAAPYTSDVYAAGDWTYAVKATGPNAGDIYRTDTGSVVMSTAPAGYIWRDGQATGWTGGTKVGDGSFTVGAGTLTFDFDASATGFLFGGTGFDFALSWAMSCANDAFQGQVGTGGGPNVPEPASVGLLLAALGGLAFARKRS